MTEIFLVAIGILASVVVIANLYCLSQKKEVTNTLSDLAINAMIYGVIAGIALSLAVS